VAGIGALFVAHPLDARVDIEVVDSESGEGDDPLPFQLARLPFLPGNASATRNQSQKVVRLLTGIDFRRILGVRGNRA